MPIPGPKIGFSSAECAFSVHPEDWLINCTIQRRRPNQIGRHAKDRGCQMCLAVPGKVLNLLGEDPAFRSGNVDFCGVRKTINLAFTPEVQPGDFVLVHVGFAISRIDAEEASRTFAYLKQIGALAEEGLAQPVEGSGPA